MLLSLNALGCFDKYVSYLLNINIKLTYPQGQMLQFSFWIPPFEKHCLSPHVFFLDSPTLCPLPLLTGCFREGKVPSSRPLVKVNLVPGSNPLGSLMDIHTSENAVKKLLKWNAIPAVAITSCSYFLVETLGRTTTAYQQADDGRKRCKSHKQ